MRTLCLVTVQEKPCLKAGLKPLRCLLSALWAATMRPSIIQHQPCEPVQNGLVADGSGEPPGPICSACPRAGQRPTSAHGPPVIPPPGPHHGPAKLPACTP